ncbi:MAG TPA: hypothetical protein VII49_09030 [Rhizomicrobium sp.]
MPKTISQWAGMTVTGIIVFGCDPGLAYALPLGIFAGTLATVFVSFLEKNTVVRQRTNPR